MNMMVFCQTLQFKFIPEKYQNKVGLAISFTKNAEISWGSNLLKRPK